jgi:hypothetical protein
VLLHERPELGVRLGGLHRPERGLAPRRAGRANGAETGEVRDRGVEAAAGVAHARLRGAVDDGDVRLDDLGDVLRFLDRHRAGRRQEGERRGGERGAREDARHGDPRRTEAPELAGAVLDARGCRPRARAM